MLDTEILMHNNGGGEGPTPFFPKTHQNLDLGMGKNGKKVYEKRGKQTFYFQNRKKSHFFPRCAKIWIWGWEKCEKMGKKVNEREEKVFVLTNCCTLLSLFSAF